MTFRVEILPAALADVEEAYLWWREHVPELAEAWFDGLGEAIESLDEFPERCAVAPESEDVNVEVRQLLYGRGRSVYRVLFRIAAPNLVRVLRIRHSARDRLEPEELIGDA